ncbi:M42 family metallopeptidase [Litoribacter ruber]|uniref:M42 family metallopeptidase n=1 Tax=Litoribacter ruber TaxID=702568 RepID=UPI001BD99DD3|nr:M42 family metallopeptidase [Litoribacter ruber]MBT0811958.1 M42 family metallopeptidase [Litoribacter ruber]
MNIELLKNVCEKPGAPGFEAPIRNYILEVLENLADEVKVDNMGSVIAIKRGNNNPENKKVMVAAHMDEIGFIVTHIDDQGFVRFHPLGGFDPKTLTAQRVIIHGKQDIIGVMGSKPIHVMSQEERAKLPKLTDYFIDLGMSKEEAEKVIKVGDPITRERQLIEMGDCVNCKSIDNRVAVFILLETLRTVGEMPFDLYATFTVQEEVGLRGANVAAHQINPDFGIALDTTIAYDVPGAQGHEKITELGKGTAIKIMDAMTICDYRMVDYMKKTADEKAISWQPEILTAGGTDTAGLQRMGKQGAIAGAISIPTRHLHQVIEMAHKKDIQGSIDLLNACLENMDQYDWTH